jgi:hypothetical protein
LSLKEKLPLINSGSKGTRIAGYILYGFIFLMILGIILPAPEETTTSNEDTSDSEGLDPSTVDSQDDVKATVKKGTDVVHMMDMSEIPTDAGYTKDGAPYTVTSTGKHLKGYADYTGDGYAVVLQPRRSSMTKNEFMDVLDTLHRVE